MGGRYGMEATEDSNRREALRAWEVTDMKGVLPHLGSVGLHEANRGGDTNI